MIRHENLPGLADYVHEEGEKENGFKEYKD